MNTSLRDGIDWVGFIDWNVRDFHGYHTSRGSTYNSYLVRDKKTALIDTVKAPYVQSLLSNMEQHVDPASIDVVVCNHAEPDHSGGLPEVMKACSGAELVCDEKCAKALGMHYDTSGWRMRTVADGDSISLGDRTLSFVETPMVHWPESMFTYIPEEKILFSMDAFGQHYASVNRFDDEAPLDVVMAEAKTYYANIVMLYGKPIARVLERAAQFDIEMIAPSHGVIWRKHLDTIISAYTDWVVCKAKPKVVVVYDTMWKSTEMMAEAIMEGIENYSVEARLINIRAAHITEVATEALDAAVIAFGSPTLNGGLMPQMAAALTYLKGLKPQGKSAIAFGSYGWAKGGAEDIQQYLEAMKMNIVREPLSAKFVPDEDVLDECRKVGKQLAQKALEEGENSAT